MFQPVMTPMCTHNCPRGTNYAQHVTRDLIYKTVRTAGLTISAFIFPASRDGEGVETRLPYTVIFVRKEYR